MPKGVRGVFYLYEMSAALATSKLLACCRERRENRERRVRDCKSRGAKETWRTYKLGVDMSDERATKISTPLYIWRGTLVEPPPRSAPLPLVATHESYLSTAPSPPKTLTASPKHLRSCFHLPKRIHPVCTSAIQSNSRPLPRYPHMPNFVPLLCFSLLILLGFGIIGYGILCMIRDSQRWN